LVSLNQLARRVQLLYTKRASFDSYIQTNQELSVAVDAGTEEATQATQVSAPLRLSISAHRFWVDPQIDSDPGQKSRVAHWHPSRPACRSVASLLCKSSCSSGMQPIYCETLRNPSAGWKAGRRSIFRTSSSVSSNANVALQRWQVA